MPKPELRKYLNAHTKQQLVEIIMKMYSLDDLTKNYCEHLMKPALIENGMMEKCRQKILKEFNMDNPASGRQNFATAKKAISEFATLRPNKEMMADIMMTLPEAACEFTDCFGDMEERYYTAAYNSFERALKFLKDNGLLDMMKDRCTKCVKYASSWGYGFADDMQDLFASYYGGRATFVDNRY